MWCLDCSWVQIGSDDKFANHPGRDLSVNADYTILVETIMLIPLRRLHEAQSGFSTVPSRKLGLEELGETHAKEQKKWHPCNISYVWYCRICLLLVCWGPCHQQAIGRDLVLFHSDT